MEDWYDLKWRKEQEEMDCRRKMEEWERLSEIQLKFSSVLSMQEIEFNEQSKPINPL